MKKLASLVILLFCAAAVSAQQKQRIAVLPSLGDLDPTRLVLLTDKVREIATQHLPMENFNILKQDVITKMIGEEELYRACKEGVCIGDLAKRTNSNYGARCDVIKLDNSLVLKFEIYSVDEDAIFETFTVYDLKDFRAILKVLEARLPKTFQKVVTAYNSGSKASLNKIQLAAPSEPAPKADSQSLPPRIYTLTTAADPPDGGRISRSPNYSSYYAGSNVTVIAIPYAGYTFAGWSGGTTSANPHLRVTIDRDLTLTANFRRTTEPAPKPKIEPPPAAPTPLPTPARVRDRTPSREPPPAATAPPPAVAVAQPKPEPAPPKPTPTPEYKPPEPPKRKNTRSFGAGGFFANDAGGGLKWSNGEQIAMPYTGGGVYTYIDFTYTEFVIGLSGGGGKWKSADADNPEYLPDMSRTYINFAAFVKIPFGAENVKFFPLLGLDYEASISAQLKGGNGIYAPDNGGLSAMWVKLGGGIDIGLGEKAYLRGELLYGWRTPNSYEQNNNFRAQPIAGSGITLKTGIGFNF